MKKLINFTKDLFGIIKDLVKEASFIDHLIFIGLVIAVYGESTKSIEDKTATTILLNIMAGFLFVVFLFQVFKKIKK